MIDDWRIWNDSTVPRLAQAIYDDRRFDLMPMLADALEESGYPDESLPPKFRDSELTRITAIRLLAPIIGVELKKAVGWMEAFAKRLGPGKIWGGAHTRMTYEDLVGFAEAFLKDRGNDYVVQKDSDHWRSTMWEEGVTMEFWENYEIVTGTKVEDSRDSFFDCTC